MILDVLSGGGYAEGKYVAACIDSPEDASRIEESLVLFNASCTRAIEVVADYAPLTHIFPGSKKLSWDWEFSVWNSGVRLTRSFSDSLSAEAYLFFTEFPRAGNNNATLVVGLD